ncbi:MAG: Ig-like domain-containing protein, partial [Bacteroidales bacterium]|nr:Ig-like domain-containing protein [Bacteroidales bacterium]
KIKLLILPTILLLIMACAKQVAITGGPKDTKPPVMEKSTPENGSVNFAEEKIYIEFDEYVKLNSLNQKLIISPPIDKEPNIVIKGKGIKISLDPEILLPNTTYSFNFNDAIADNNENNALHSFVYAFSTGEFIDSLSFSGIVLDAFTKSPVKDVWVILHDDLSDSAINSLSPKYITKVDENGQFLIPFVKENQYKIYALKDNNFNYNFDIPGEGIAFIDSVFTPGVKKVQANDSVQPKIVKFPDDVELLLFSENKQAQFVNYYKRTKPEYIEFAFNSKQTENFEVSVFGDDEAIMIFNENPDTIKIWLQDSDIIDSELVNVFCSYVDPVYLDTLRTDTLVFRKPESSVRDSIFKLNINSHKEPHLPLYIKCNHPIEDFDQTKMWFELKSDSIFIPVPFKIARDSISPMRLIVEAEILEKSDYRLIAGNDFATDIYGLKNSAETYSISTESSSEYGNLQIGLIGEGSDFIIQLLLNDRIVSETIGVDGIAVFEYLKPAKYKIRAIEDSNGNNRWDTGDYNLKLQPEPVYYMPAEYEIRSNWNHEIEWNPVTNVTK